jgi:hypothetical protein
MAFKSYWDENKEVLINQALVDYKEKDCPSAGFNIIRYTDKGVLSFKTEFQDLAQKMLSEQPYKETKYAILQLAKLGALEWNGS